MRLQIASVCYRVHQRWDVVEGGCQLKEKGEKDGRAGDWDGKK